MGLRDLLPGNIYSTAGATSVVPAVPTSGAPINQRRAVAYSAAEAPPAKKAIEMYSKDFYIACAIGGWLSCGLTHMAVTPLDVVKCNLQTDPKKYGSIGNGFSVVMKEGGVSGLFKGWLPTLIGYGFQGVCKFGFYEYFKKYGNSVEEICFRPGFVMLI
jgi:solute carrier family 25 (mitochondrial phosphate transporter), member 3